MSTTDLLLSYSRAMRRSLGLGCQATLLRQLVDSEFEALGRRRLLSRPTEPLAVLHTTGWSSVEKWRAGLSRKRRYKLRQTERALSEGSAVEVALVPGASLEVAETVALLRHNERKYGGGPFSPLPQSTGYLAELLRQPDVLAICYRDRSTGVLLAIGTVFDHRDRPVLRHYSALPIVRARFPDLNLYTNLYQLLVGWAIEASKEQVIIGKGMLDIKQSLGAELLPQYAAVVR
ncbi:hypothetical protein [Kribbella turkmenica]|nr:hypothetical protein [Kribbella turkmenica]